MRQAAIERNTKETQITLKLNLDGTGKDRLLLNGSSKSLTVDLNGHTVDLHRTSKGDTKHVFEAKGGATLTIKDSAGTGGITGGWEENGGGIYVNSNSTVRLYNVKVYGNKAGSDGGGIYAIGTLEMYGGSVTGNTASDNGEGIYTTGDTDFTLKAVTISNNTATNGGGGLNIHLAGDDSYIRACRITGNKTTGSNGGGFSIDAGGNQLGAEEGPDFPCYPRPPQRCRPCSFYRSSRSPASP